MARFPTLALLIVHLLLGPAGAAVLRQSASFLTSESHGEHFVSQHAAVAAEIDTAMMRMGAAKSENGHGMLALAQEELSEGGALERSKGEMDLLEKRSSRMDCTEPNPVDDDG